jgi:hypothetical protein
MQAAFFENVHSDQIERIEMKGLSHMNFIDKATLDPPLKIATRHYFGPLGYSVESIIEKNLVNAWL